MSVNVYKNLVILSRDFKHELVTKLTSKNLWFTADENPFLYKSNIDQIILGYSTCLSTNSEITQIQDSAISDIMSGTTSGEFLVEIRCQGANILVTRLFYNESSLEKYLSMFREYLVCTIRNTGCDLHNTRFTMYWKKRVLTPVIKQAAINTRLLLEKTKHYTFTLKNIDNNTTTATQSSSVFTGNMDQNKSSISTTFTPVLKSSTDNTISSGFTNSSPTSTNTSATFTQFTPVFTPSTSTNTKIFNCTLPSTSTSTSIVSATLDTMNTNPFSKGLPSLASNSTTTNPFSKPASTSNTSNTTNTTNPFLSNTNPFSGTYNSTFSTTLPSFESSSILKPATFGTTFGNTFGTTFGNQNTNNIFGQSKK